MIKRIMDSWDLYGMKDVEEAQQKIVASYQKLEDSGDMSFQEAEVDDIVV